MKTLELRYLAVVYPITKKLEETGYQTNAETMRELIQELDETYGGFQEMFISEETNQLSLNTMIYYADKGKPTKGVLNLDQSIQDGGKVIFW